MREGGVRSRTGTLGMRHMRTTFAARLGRGLAIFLLLLPAFTLAQDAGPSGDVRRGPGLELALFGHTTGIAGHPLSLTGVAYEVRDLATLARLPGARIDARLELRGADNQTTTQEIARSETTANAAGQFVLQFAIPNREATGARLRVRVSQRGFGERTFDFAAFIRDSSEIEVRTDRILYEPSETAHVWTRAFDVVSHEPRANAIVHLECTDPAERVLGSIDTRTAESGAVTADFALPPSAMEGRYSVVGYVRFPTHHVPINTTFNVGRRTVERILLTAELDQRVVRPGATLSGTVHVRTAAGAPVRNTTVTVANSVNDEGVAFETNTEGDATFRVLASAFLADTATEERLIFRVVHPAYGVQQAALTYRLARTPFIVDIAAENGALVPEIDSTAYVSIETAAGEPAPAGLNVGITGSAVRNGSFRGTTDEHGLLSVPVRLPQSAVAPSNTASSQCVDSVSTQLAVTIEGPRPASSRVQVCASTAADLGLSVEKVVIAPGAEVRFRVARRPRAVGRAVLVELHSNSAALPGSTWLSPSESDGAIRIPDTFQGFAILRARTVVADNTLAGIHEESPPMAGSETSQSIIVRPADAFALSIQAPTDAAAIRSNANVVLQTGTRSGPAYAAVLVRDVAASNGEEPWKRAWIDTVAEDALVAPASPSNDLFLRAALAATSPIPTEPTGNPALVPYPWDEEGEPYNRHGGLDATVALRDPVVTRAEYLRRQLGELMVLIENAVAAIGSDPETARGIVVRTGNRSQFDPRILDTLVDQGDVEPRMAATLGDSRATIAMIERADSSFSFDRVARRIARRRLVVLMTALVNFTNPDDATAAREASSEPPERWLSRMLDRGRITADDLMDPWNHAFAFRRVTNGTPRVVLSDRAPMYELVSAGPDGVAGNTDDVRDPFERVVPTETVYAVASGEDELMRSLASISAGSDVLDSMLAAYESYGIQAEEERRRSIVVASASELVIEDSMAGDVMGGGGGMGEGTIGLGRIGTIGHGGGSGSGEGYGSGGGRSGGRAARAPMIRSADGAMAEIVGRVARPDVAMLAAMRRALPPGSLGEMGEAVRERFPATLFFAGDVRLNPAGSTTMAIATADALTTYTVEAIAWTRSGWVTSARAELRVDQAASVDAPVPSVARVGDAVRVPVRVQNHTNSPLRVRVDVASEGEIGIDPVPASTLEVRPHDAAVVVVPVTMRRAGMGALVVRAARENERVALDAVRRPLRIAADARPVHVEHEEFFRGATEFVVRVPADATPRGTSQVRARFGESLFADLSGNYAAGQAATVLWAYRAAGRAVPDALALAAIAQTRNAGASCDVGVERAVQFVLSSYDNASVPDDEVKIALDCINAGLPSDDQLASLDNVTGPMFASQPTEILRWLAPTVRLVAARPNLREDLERLVVRVRTIVERVVPLKQDAPEAWTHAAVGLALMSPDNAVARELLRRTERYVVRVGNRALLDSDLAPGDLWARVIPTARLSLLFAVLNRPDDTMACIREILRSLGQDVGVDAFATAAAMRLSGEGASTEMQLEIDGQRVAFERVNGSWIANTPQLQTPGAHRVRMHGRTGAAAVVMIDVDYGRPWTTVDRDALLEVALDGEVGARETRAGMRLTVRNRGPRTAVSPVVAIDLPAGAELDEHTTQRLRALTMGYPMMDGQTLYLRLHALAPGAFVRLPVSVRWSLGGQLRGLGIVAYDEASELDASGTRPTHSVASRVVSIPDQGAQPREAPAETSPPPPPLPEPRPPIRPLGPVAEVIR